uniref:polypeptide N-acetylgalactosaminyltransferase 10-like n=1 Tax=Myxine glutinosa TaxID=7769 RepID=UPI00358E655F
GTCLCLTAIVLVSLSIVGKNNNAPAVVSRQARSTAQDNETELIDYQNHTSLRLQAARLGPGEQGRPYTYSSYDRRVKLSGYQSYGYNGHVSSKISVDRAIPDTRHSRCASMRYPRSLPSVSVVITYHNEHWSALLRTLRALSSRTPPALLAEIILVDDSSDEGDVAGKLSRYREDLPPLRLTRLRQRAGPLVARTLAARLASAPVLVFLDSHCEPNANWLPPLLERLLQSKHTVACPLVDSIDHGTFEYRTQRGGPRRGAFDWNLDYKRLPLPSTQPQYLPYSTAVLGGVFAVWREYFEKIGGYDPGLEVMGGENLALSFKVWMCGGRIEEVPCSRVGHVFKKFLPYTIQPISGSGSVILQNLKRVAETWMDDYAEVVYRLKPALRAAHSSNVPSERVALQGLSCHNFSWYLSEVAPEVTEYFPIVEPPAIASGKIRNVGARRCLSASASGITLQRCKRGLVSEQNITLSWRGELRGSLGGCLDATHPGARVKTLTCHGERGNQLWRYKQEKQQVYHPASNSCLVAEGDGQTQLLVQMCDLDSTSQQWVL